MDKATEVKFQDGLNILVGDNGVGKSTVLEILYYIFTVVLFKPYKITHEQIFDARSLGIKEDPLANRNNKNKPKAISLTLRLDSTDIDNIKILEEYHKKDNFNEAMENLKKLHGHDLVSNCIDDFNEIFNNYDEKYEELTLNIIGNKLNETELTDIVKRDWRYLYLKNNVFYRELIEFHKKHNALIDLNLSETVTHLKSTRSYRDQIFKQTAPLNENLQEKEKGNLRNNARQTLTSEDLFETEVFAPLLRNAIYEYRKRKWNDGEKTILKDLNDMKILENINEKLSKLKIITKFNFSTDDQEQTSLMLELHDKSTKQKINIQELSTGQKAFVYMVFRLFNTGSARTIIIDEPALHMHPAYQEELANLFSEASKNCQIILVTHNSLFLKQLFKQNDAININNLSREKGFTEVIPIDKHALSFISANEINYLAFKLLSVEYFIELYAEMMEQHGCHSITKMDNILTNNYKVPKNDKKWQGPRDDELKSVTLITYIRNAIYHPDNINIRRCKDTPYTQNQFKQSVDKMREILLKKKKKCADKQHTSDKLETIDGI